MQRYNVARYARLPGRVLIGHGFIEHDFARLWRSPDPYAGILQQVGVLAAWLTRRDSRGLRGVARAGVLPSIPMAVVLLVAKISVHSLYGFSSVKLSGLYAGRGIRSAER
jgi:putative oxidoreductase